MTAHTADEIIEAMARAIWRQHGITDTQWENLYQSTRDTFMAEMRPAYAECLRMLADPAACQKDAAMHANFSTISQTEDGRPYVTVNFWVVYRAMIDARLKELG